MRENDFPQKTISGCIQSRPCWIIFDIIFLFLLHVKKSRYSKRRFSDFFHRGSTGQAGEAQRLNPETKRRCLDLCSLHPRVKSHKQDAPPPQGTAELHYHTLFSPRDFFLENKTLVITGSHRLDHRWKVKSLLCGKLLKRY